jgi:hypothetical protein
MKNEDQFREHLKRLGKKPHVIDGLIMKAQHFESWLTHNKNKQIEQASKEDLVRYVDQLDRREVKINMRALALFYGWTGKDDLTKIASSMREAETAKTRRIFNIREFRGVDPADVNKLEALEIKNIIEMLEVGKTPELRKELATRSGVQLEKILELVKLSDISRIGGVKSIRARLYVDAGIDTIDAFGQWEAQALKTFMEKFVQYSGFDGVPPLLKEIEFTQYHAARLPRIVEY